jgi:hypothetical protein
MQKRDAWRYFHSVGSVVQQVPLELDDANSLSVVSDDGLTAVPHPVALLTARHVVLDGSLFGWTGVHCFWWFGMEAASAV